MHENLCMRNLYFVFTMLLRVQNELVGKLHVSSHQKDYFDPNSFSICAGSSTASSTNKSFASKDKDNAEWEERARCKRHEGKLEVMRI